MDLKISDTNKGKKSLIYDGFIYRIDGVLKCGDISWRCTNKKYKGRLRTDSAVSTMKLKDSNCYLKSKGKQRTISPPDLQKSLGLSYINLLISLWGRETVQVTYKSN